MLLHTLLLCIYFFSKILYLYLLLLSAMINIPYYANDKVCYATLLRYNVMRGGAERRERRYLEGNRGLRRWPK